MKIKTTMLKSDLCDSSVVHIILKGKKTTAANISAPPATKDKKVMKQQTIYRFQKTKTDVE